MELELSTHQADKYKNCVHKKDRRSGLLVKSSIRLSFNPSYSRNEVFDSAMIAGRAGDHEFFASVYVAKIAVFPALFREECPVSNLDQIGDKGIILFIAAILHQRLPPIWEEFYSPHSGEQ